MREVDPRTPVLVGAGVADQQLHEPGAGVEAVELMARSVEAAVRDAGRRDLLDRIQWIGVPEGIWDYTDPARLIARRLGVPDAHTLLSQVGVLQQDLIARACRLIADGELDVAVVTGGEAKYRAQVAARTGIEAEVTVQDDVVPDETVRPAALGLAELEIVRNVVSPVQAFAMIENARRFDQGWTIDDHRRRVSELWARFGRIAAGNPHAWDRSAPSAEAIREPGPGNRMIAFPYTKRLSSQWNVDQAAGLVLCSVEAARRWGIDQERWVFPHGSSVSNHAVPPAQRPRLNRSPGAAAAGTRALELSGVGVDDLTHVDLYSCFPAAVQVFAAELGLSLERDLTVTGGMTFAGGPLNNYVLQALARLVGLLREQPGCFGLSSSVSGFLVKQGFGVWSTTPPTAGFRHDDVTAEVTVAHPELPLVDQAEGEARVVSYTVDFVDDQGTRVVAVLDLEGGGRTIGVSTDGDLVAQVTEEEWIGQRVTVLPDGTIVAGRP